MKINHKLKKYLLRTFSGLETESDAALCKWLHLVTMDYNKLSKKKRYLPICMNALI